MPPKLPRRILTELFNQHGPGRLRLPFIQNGFRYKATDLPSSGPSAEMPEWMAIYDVSNMTELIKEPYTSLRKAPLQSQRERDTMKEIVVHRRFFDQITERVSEKFRILENVEEEGKGNVMIAVCIIAKPEGEEELDKWYKEEHVPLLMKVPGWLRTRRFVTAAVEGSDKKEFLALHEYAPENGLGGPEYVKATTTEWNQKVMSKLVIQKKRRAYELAYTFGAAPRDLKSISGQQVFASDRTTTKIEDGPVIESWITTSDGVDLPFRLEGSTDPDAPLIVLSNSILVTWGIWDAFLKQFFANPTNKKYRVVRYLTRGRSSAVGSTPVTVEVLASDIIAILDALRVPQAECVMGVSLGGVTCLATALLHPDRIKSFVACDTSSKSPAGNSKAWSERIAIAEKEGAQVNSKPVVGDELAEVTTRRWFVNASYEDAALEKECLRVKEMVRTNSLAGFRESVKALWEYDFKPLMPEYKGKGAFLVGAGDGILPGTMKDMAASLGNGADYVVIDGAGHLPMGEKPAEVAAALGKFLED